MTPYSSILAWKIPWMEEPGGLQSMGSLRDLTIGKTIALTIWTFISKVISLLFNTLSRCVIAFLPRSKPLVISWLQSPSAVILEPKKIQ